MRALPLLLVAGAAPALAATVRTDHPRILLSNGSGFGTSLQAFKTRCSTDPAYQARCNGSFANPGGTWPAIASAAKYLVNGNTADCATAVTTALAMVGTPGQPDPHSFISNNGRTMDNLAVVLDWCDAALSATQRSQLEAAIVTYADWYSQSPSPETYDVFHDDAPNVGKAVALAGLALKGSATNDAKAVTYLAWADNFWKQIELPAMAYVGDWWHEGMVYVQPSLGGVSWYAMAWSTATDENIFNYVQTHANDLFNGYLAFFAYAMRPDYKYFYFGDVTDNKMTIELFSRVWVDMWTTGTGSALGQGLSLEIKANSRPGYDYSGADGYLSALFYDHTKDGTAVPRSTLPTARWMSRGANDVVVIRSGWGADDTAIMITCGDYLGPHQHDETGSFQIFHHAELTGATGYYDNFDTPHWDNYYSQHSVHANTLAVLQPGELFPNSYYLLNPAANNVNEGGQRPLRRDKNGNGYPSPDLSTYLRNKTAGPSYETGNVQAFEQDACHAYVACDVTAAYNSPLAATNGNPPKVNEVARQFVFLPPDHLVVFDRVESTDAGYPKTFILHAVGQATPNGNGTFSLSFDGGTLLGSTVMPTSAHVTAVNNFTVAGTPWPPSTPGLEQGGTRLEISPPTQETRDYFLHVLDATDTGVYPSATLNETAGTASIHFSDSAASYLLTFNKTGALGGHLQVTADGGNVLCDLALGGGSGSDGGTAADGGNTDGGVAGDGGAGGPDGSTGADGGPGGTSKSGCGCASTGPALCVALAVAAIVARRRRRAGGAW
jgi:uncharacterized protein (TIGR03382 family)